MKTLNSQWYGECQQISAIYDHYSWSLSQLARRRFGQIANVISYLSHSIKTLKLMYYFPKQGNPLIESIARGKLNLWARLWILLFESPNLHHLSLERLSAKIREHNRIIWLSNLEKKILLFIFFRRSDVDSWKCSHHFSITDQHRTKEEYLKTVFQGDFISWEKAILNLIEESCKWIVNFESKYVDHTPSQKCQHHGWTDASPSFR